MAEDLVGPVRAMCRALPETTERLSHGTPTFFVRGRTAFVSCLPHGHHHDTFPHLCCAAPAGAQEGLIAADPARFFRPPYVGHRGWLGVRLDRGVDWTEIAGLVEDAYRTVAPRTLIARLDAG